MKPQESISMYSERQQKHPYPNDTDANLFWTAGHRQKIRYTIVYSASLLTVRSLPS